MSKNKLINELFWLRFIACLAVVVGHAIQTSESHFLPDDSALGISAEIRQVIYLSLLFGTPVFVFISEFLLAKSYPVNVPKGFIKKRVQYLLVPYLFMSVVYAFIEAEVWSVKGLSLEIAMNIFLGDSTVYFILIIFQFYFLHIILNRYLNKWSPKVVIVSSFIINVVYLSIFNFIKSPDTVYAQYIWQKGYWIPFVGWLFYFTVAYYCGKHYSEVLKFLNRHRLFVIIMPVITFMLVLVVSKVLVTVPWSSKRIDMILYSLSVIFFIIYVTSKLKTLPSIVMFISSYSFSIYLLHKAFLALIKVIASS
ncbi:acyltransferase family protein [Priestia flexa]|uniref:acyltransferase family protein n=1 Tax=Priestia flexa TaxID=86664 RepID=UPI000CC35D69|nr:acyltransferase family protein [Priestia flexa]MEC0667005.1 acyltransferase family protein [Priestia flexa]